jgi:chemotaxis signal transduction protein
MSPYDLLLGLALLRERDKSAQNVLKEYSGILVEAAGDKLLINQDAVEEMITVNEVTNIIDDRIWLTGLINYRGRLLPLVELRTLLDSNSPKLGLKDRKVLILSRKDIPGQAFIGLSVDQIKGIRHYWSDDNNFQESEQKHTGLIETRFNYKKSPIAILNLETLAKQIGFRQSSSSKQQPLAVS